MAKAKKPPSKKRGKQAADKAVEEAQLALPMPKDRDLKHHISAWQLGKERVKKANADLAAIELAADEAGVSVKAIKDGVRIAHAKNPLQAKSDLLQTALVLQELGSPFQIQVFDVKFGSPEAEGKAAGYRDGKAGRDRDYGQWVKGSPSRRAYDQGYDEAQIENMPISPQAKVDAKAKLKVVETSPAH